MDLHPAGVRANSRTASGRMISLSPELGSAWNVRMMVEKVGVGQKSLEIGIHES